MPSIMTLLEITYQLQEPLTPHQLGLLGSFANTYGLRRFRVDETKNHLSFEYDASRLTETQVIHMLRAAKIPVTGKIAAVVGSTTDPLPLEPAALTVSRAS
ncbi:MAG: hypothetical protein ABSG69_14020 [Candidatus Acidiferrum sp.]|jgi:hypothetical protein